MYPIHRILVAIKDPRAGGVGMLEKVAQLARALDADVELFHALCEPVYIDSMGLAEGAYPDFEQDARKACLTQLERVASRLRRKGVLSSTAAEWDFPAYEAIVRRAARTDANLIVADCHAHAHHAPWLLRFTDWELVRLACVPVLLLKSHRAYKHPRILAALDPGRAFGKPADLDGQILHIGGAVADALQGTLHAVHGYGPVIANEGAAAAGLQQVLRWEGLPAKRRHLLAQDGCTAIETVARQIGSAVVVMGAISRHGMSRMVIGNTAERLLDRLDCDALIVKPAGFRNRITRASRGMPVVTVPA